MKYKFLHDDEEPLQYNWLFGLFIPFLERYHLKYKVGRSTDIWSFGCVATYMSLSDMEKPANSTPSGTIDYCTPKISYQRAMEKIANPETKNFLQVFTQMSS